MNTTNKPELETMLKNLYSIMCTFEEAAVDFQEFLKQHEKFIDGSEETSTASTTTVNILKIFDRHLDDLYETTARAVANTQKEVISNSKQFQIGDFVSGLSITEIYETRYTNEHGTIELKNVATNDILYGYRTYPVFKDYDGTEYIVLCTGHHEKIYPGSREEHYGNE